MNTAKKLDQYNISYIEPKNIDVVWKNCEKLLRKSCQRSNNRSITEQIYVDCKNLTSTLWVIFDENNLEIVACIVTNIKRYPTEIKSLFIEHLSGKKMIFWKDLFLNCMIKFAKNNQCSVIESIGRDGFMNWIKDDNRWNSTHRVYEMKLEGEQ